MLEHLIRAAGSIANDPEIVVIGSQSVLGQFPQAPAELLVSAEADVFPLNRPELADVIDGSIGEGLDRVAETQLPQSLRAQVVARIRRDFNERASPAGADKLKPRRR